MSKYELACAYAQCSINYFNSGNLRLAIKFWNKIYSLNLPPEQLSPVMSKFTDEQVFRITDIIRTCYYRGVGLL